MPTNMIQINWTKNLQGHPHIEQIHSWEWFHLWHMKVLQAGWLETELDIQTAYSKYLIPEEKKSTWTYLQQKALKRTCILLPEAAESWRTPNWRTPKFSWEHFQFYLWEPLHQFLASKQPQALKGKQSGELSDTKDGPIKETKWKGFKLDSLLHLDRLLRLIPSTQNKSTAISFPFPRSQTQP